MMKGDGAMLDTEGKLALKFVMSKLKRLVTDSCGETSYMENLDEIFKDVFDVKNFTKRLDDCYDDRETVITVNEIGMKNLMTICNTPRMYNVFLELVAMNAQVHKLSRSIRKAAKKGKKKDKSMVKELNYMLDTYKDAVKTLKKKFGIAKKSSYKKRFRNVTDMIDSRKGFSYYDEDEGLTSILYDDGYSDDDGDGSSDFERYIRNVTGNKMRRNKGRGGNFRSSRLMADEDYDSEYDFEDEEDELDDLDENEIEARIDTLTEHMATLTSAVEALINTGKVPEPRVHQRPTPSAAFHQPPQPAAANDMPSTEISRLTSAVMMMVKAQRESIEKQDEMYNVMGNLAQVMTESMDDIIDDEDTVQAVVQGDVHIHTDSTKVDVNGNTARPRNNNAVPLTSEEIIHIVNSEKPANLSGANQAAPENTESSGQPQT